MNVDVAIVGSGPGGAIAAYELAASGLKVVVLEREPLPRPKPCGGLMPAAVAQLADLPFHKLVNHRVQKSDFFYKFEQPLHHQTSDYSLLLTNRSRFDAGILEYALQRSNGNLLIQDGFKVSDVQECPGYVDVRGSGHNIRARAVIAADGALSPTARSLGMQPRRSHPVAIDAEIQVTPRFYDQVCDRLRFNYFYLPAGYGWVFPKADGLLSCGVGSWVATRTPLKQIMAAYISDSIPARDIVDLQQKGHPIPAYAGTRTIATKRVCLVGDAAGLVDPVTGEGIRFALISGISAARNVRQALLEEDSNSPGRLDCRMYQKEIDDSIGKSLETKYRYAALPFIQAPDFYYRKFILGGWSKGGQLENPPA